MVPIVPTIRVPFLGSDRAPNNPRADSRRWARPGGRGPRRANRWRERSSEAFPKTDVPSLWYACHRAPLRHAHSFRGDPSRAALAARRETVPTWPESAHRAAAPAPDSVHAVRRGGHPRSWSCCSAREAGLPDALLGARQRGFIVVDIQIPFTRERFPSESCSALKTGSRPRRSSGAKAARRRYSRCSDCLGLSRPVSHSPSRSRQLSLRRRSMS